MSRILSFGGKTPRVAPDAFVAPGATLIGDVTVESGASVWFGAVLRGDNPKQGIVVREGANVQDNVVIHVGDWAPTVVGAGATVGHGAVFESCAIGEGSLVGINAVILPECEIGPESLIAAGCVLLEGTEVPARSVVAGVPGKIRKSLDGSSADWVRGSGHHYRELARAYLDEGHGTAPTEGHGTVAPAGSSGPAAPPGERAQRAAATNASRPSPSRGPHHELAPDPAVGSPCERCGHPVLERHCKLICANCGFQRDCSDP